MYYCFFFFLGSDPEGDRRGRSPVEYRGTLYISLYVHTSPLPRLAPLNIWPRLLLDKQTGGRADGWMDVQIPLYSTVPPGALQDCYPARIIAAITKYRVILKKV